MNKSIYFITLLRHGESVGNADNILQGQSDFPLTDKGKQQARSLASHWKKMGLTFDLISRQPGRYLIISHGGLLNMVLYAVLGISPQPNFRGARFRFRNSAYANLIYNPTEHDWLLDCLNRRDHWAEDED